MAVKRKTKDNRTDVAVKEKRAKREVDVFNKLPESLQLRILSSFEAKEIVQTMAVSKTWFSLWKSVPVLKFSSAAFSKLRSFDNFVDKTLRLRDHSSTLEHLAFNRHGICSAKLLYNVFGYACAHGVKNVKLSLQSSRNKSWPPFTSLETCSKSMESLSLESENVLNFPFFGSTFGSLKNLSDLYFKRACFSDPELFTRFPSLKKLTLVSCEFGMQTTLKIEAPNLTDLIITSCDELIIVSYQLTTPKLKFFEYRGIKFPKIQAHGGLPVLESAVIEYTGALYPNMKEIAKFNDLVSMLVVVGNTKILTVYASIIYLLSLFPGELVKRNSPFEKMKLVKVDLEKVMRSSVFYKGGRWVLGLCSEVRRYLQGCPGSRLLLMNLRPHFHINQQI